MCIRVYPWFFPATLQGGDHGGSVTGGYASLTPGYYHITPDGVSVRIKTPAYRGKVCRGMVGSIELERRKGDQPLNLRQIREALCPPKPKELLRAALTVISLAVLGTQSISHSGSLCS